MRKILASMLILVMASLACQIQSVEPPSPTRLVISNPSNGATLSDPVIIEAVASNSYAFSHVDFYIDSILVAVDSTKPYQYYWNIFAYRSNVSHRLLAIGYSTDTTITSATITVSIQYTAGFSLAADYRPNSQHAVGVRPNGSFLFVSEQDLGIEVIDISSITSPEFRSRFNSQGLATRTAAAYPYVFIVSGGQGITRAGYSNPDSLVETGRFMDQNLASDAEIIGNNLFVAEYGSAVLLQGNDPDSLRELSRVTIPPIFYDATVSGNLAFLAGGDAFYIIDCSDPGNLSLMGPFGVFGLSKSVAVADTFIFVAIGDLGIKAYSIADPHNPRFLSQFDPQPNIITVATGDNTLFAGSQGGDVLAFDYSVPDTLMQIDQFASGNLIGEINYQSPYLFVAASLAVEILRFIR